MKRQIRQNSVLFEPVMRSAPMRQVDATLRMVAPKDVVISLIGESGTGKEILARRIHDLSAYRRGPFIPINCAAIPEALFESELFGHERGAFTGATERVQGKIEAASGGTLFLDEIGEMPLSMQAKLLRFLENRRFMRVGGNIKLDADVRLVCATLRHLEDEVAAKRFRADLYYRIQGITIEVPPLRTRRADIPPLITQFVAQISASHAVLPPRLTRTTKLTFFSYSWPGNIRELRNTIEMLCLLRSGKTVRVRDLPIAIQRATESVNETAPAHPDDISVSLQHSLKQIIGQVIEAATQLEGGSLSRAAARLGISVRTIQRHREQGEI